METFLPISYLNDFVFCPYSIYLHQVFDNTSDEVYSASPQQTGKAEHVHIDTCNTQNRQANSVLKGVYVISNQLGLYGKIDTYYPNQKKLVESKYHIQTIYRGYYYQLWAQYFALIEMGYPIIDLSFYSIKDHKTYPVKIPADTEKQELRNHIRKIAHFDFENFNNTNSVKCAHCIYAALCDKTNNDHVYA
ncbi:MAG: type V CRISPR-associated protein Cas4 [Bacteroidia bacterium]|nr:type V CRISPR-associated protein Cas4 [Bacteroidia bacterium]